MISQQEGKVMMYYLYYHVGMQHLGFCNIIRQDWSGTWRAKRNDQAILQCLYHFVVATCLIIWITMPFYIPFTLEFTNDIFLAWDTVKAYRLLFALWIGNSFAHSGLYFVLYRWHFFLDSSFPALDVSSQGGSFLFWWFSINFSLFQNVSDIIAPNGGNINK